MCRGQIEMSDEEKEKIRRKIIAHTQDFLDKGFKIKKIPMSESSGDIKRDFVTGKKHGRDKNSRKR